MSAPGHQSPVRALPSLDVAPTPGLRGSNLHLTPLPGRRALASVIDRVVGAPAGVAVRPLYVDSELSAGKPLTVAATHLGNAPGHAVRFALIGPNYEAERLVEVARNMATGIISVPRKLAPGQWFVAVVDTSGIHPHPPTAFVGTALVDVAAFDIG
jgi:hypothetical protein